MKMSVSGKFNEMLNKLIKIEKNQEENNLLCKVELK